MFWLNTVRNGFSITIYSGEKKTCKVRYPSDAEWCERVRRVKIYRTPVGRDKFQSDAPGQVEADADLFAKIRLDADTGVEFDPAEAGAVISKLDVCRIDKVERENGNYQIFAQVPPFRGDDTGEQVTVTLRPVTMRQAAEFERRSMTFLSGKRSQEFKSTLEPAASLFPELFVSQEGYSGAIPVVHQYAFLRELLDQTEQLAGEGDGIALPEE